MPMAPKDLADKFCGASRLFIRQLSRLRGA